MRYLNNQYSELELFKAVKYKFEKLSMKVVRLDSIHSKIEEARDLDLGILVFNVRTVCKEPEEKYRLAFNISDLLDEYRYFSEKQEKIKKLYSGYYEKIFRELMNMFCDKPQKKKHLKLVTIESDSL